MSDGPASDGDPRPFLALADGVWFGFVQAVAWVFYGVGHVLLTDELRLLGVWVWSGTFLLGVIWVVRYPWRRQTSLPWLLMLGPMLAILAFIAPVKGPPVPTIRVIRDG